MPLCSSSTLIGASVLALSTSFVFFACRNGALIKSLPSPQWCMTCMLQEAFRARKLAWMINMYGEVVGRLGHIAQVYLSFELCNRFWEASDVNAMLLLELIRKVVQQDEVKLLRA